MLKKILIIALLVIFQLSAFSQTSSLKNPTTPTVKTSDSNSSANNVTIDFQKQSGALSKGIAIGLKGFYIKGLVWAGNENANQDILIDFVRNIRVKGYTIVKKLNGNLAAVFYYPYIFDIEMNDGSTIKGAKGRIQELESFEVFNDRGREKCYTYFMRYWLEDKKIFSDNSSKNFEETPKVPKQAVIYIEFNK
jgi:hypothetical protein